MDREALELGRWNPGEARLAAPERRLLGFAIDVLILIVLSLPAVLLIVALEEPGTAGFPTSATLALQGVTGVYFVVLTAVRGQTVGKALARTRVVDLETGRIPTWTASFIRWAVPAAVAAVPVVGLAVLVVYGWLLVDPQRQGLHDKAARTLVVDSRRTAR